jgi:hypothetical protein
MKGLVLGAGAVALLVWTLIAWLGHALLVAVGGFGAANADLLPVPPEWVVFLSETLNLATGFSGVIVVTIWLIGAGLIAVGTLIGAFVAGRFAGPDKRPKMAPYPARRPMRDVEYYEPDDDDDDRRPVRGYDRDNEYRRGRGIGETIGRALRDKRWD